MRLNLAHESSRAESAESNWTSNWIPIGSKLDSNSNDATAYDLFSSKLVLLNLTASKRSCFNRFGQLA